jgi:DNA mismatch endonuclease, patch repair protein
MDHVSLEVRSKIMSSVHSRDTSAEMRVRKLVHGMGYRYALNKKYLPGKPDLVFVCRKKIIFVHGCFWHGHKCKHGHLPKTNLHYWGQKILTNKIRDNRIISSLRKSGWSVMVIWQCQIKDIPKLSLRIRTFLES